MDMYMIEGGTPLRGTVHIGGSKNSCLPIMCAALLTKSSTVLENVPDLRDIRSLIDLLEHLNARVIFKNSRMMIDPKSFDTDWVPYDVMRKMRASMYAFGPMISRLRKAAVSKPGGCNIGSRPIDLHLKGFQALGVDIVERKGYIHARHDGLRGSDFSLAGPNGPSVGATCNVVMAATLAKGMTTIRDAAREPEVQELCRFLNAMGAQIDGIGTDTLVIHGVESLSPTKWRIMPDRIEAATFAVAALITDGDLLLKNCDPQSMEATIRALVEWGALIDEPEPGTLHVRRDPSRKPTPLNIVTAPYPEIPTDVQPLFVALLGLTPGQSRVEDTIYHERFMHLDELNRLGGRMRREHNTAVIDGVECYEGAAVMASDLRAGAALALAALAARGESQVRRIYHVERGYERFEQKLALVGAKIRRENEQEKDPGLEFDWSEALSAEEAVETKS